ncbi:hypothetical protein DFJ58DRAFT_669453, partial [Suillus subalutaceus]|uniref:uncharacterized protein n=1 Tax=Suillus subalutaceus TaxID=48586 RepID=UPI001B86042B
KLKAGKFCKLHYFTNKRLSNAKVTVLVGEPDAIIMLPKANGPHTWVPATMVNDPSASAIIKDENPTWEEFNEAGSCMITMIKVQDSHDCINMHIQF